MKIEIIAQKKNPLMAREEVRARINYDAATPSREDIVKKLAEKLRAVEELVILDRIKTATGKPEAIADALIYKKREDIPKYLSDKMIRRKPKAKGGAGPAEAPAEKPAAVNADAKEKV
jgi:ribosomal protein S24E